MGIAPSSRSTLLQRLGLRRLPAGHEIADGQLLLLRVSIWLTLVGPTISLVALALPGPSGRDVAGAVATAVVGYAIAAILLTSFERTPFWAFPVFAAVIIGVGKEKAKWRCLVRNGKAADVKSLTSEGAL